MGTQPEEIEHALRGKRTLPKPGEPTEMKEGEQGEQSESAPGSDKPGGVRGRGGKVLSEEEEHKFQARGGRWNAASEEER